MASTKSFQEKALKGSTPCYKWLDAERLLPCSCRRKFNYVRVRASECLTTVCSASLLSVKGVVRLVIELRGETLFVNFSRLFSFCASRNPGVIWECWLIPWPTLAGCSCLIFLLMQAFSLHSLFEALGDYVSH